MNDNGDGTFSVTKLYPAPTSARAYRVPPVVVSQKPLDPSEPEMREPHRPENLSGGSRKSPDPAGDEDNERGLGETTPGSVAGQPSIPAASESAAATEMWEYIKPHLTRTETIPDTGHVRPLLSLPRVRRIDFNPDWPNEWMDSTPKDIASFIVHVTGEPAPHTCDRCARGKGPYRGCIVISSHAPEAQQRAIISCANCLYHANQKECSLKAKLRRRAANLFAGDGGPAAPHPIEDGRASSPPQVQIPPAPAQTAGPPAVQDPLTKCRHCAQGGSRCEGGDKDTDAPCYHCYKNNQRCNWDLTGANICYSSKARAMYGMGRATNMDNMTEPGADLEDEPPVANALLDDAVSDTEPGGDAKHPGAQEGSTQVDRCMVTLRIPSLRKASSNSNDATATARAPPRAEATAEPAPKPASAAAPLAAVVPGQVHLPSPEDLEMEEWEVAPGQIRAESSESESKSALSSPPNRAVLRPPAERQASLTPFL